MSEVDEAPDLDAPDLPPEMGADPVEAGETPDAVEAEEEVVVTIGDETDKDPETTREAPPWVKEVRREIRELRRENKTLRKQVEVTRPAETNPAPGPKPTLEAADYDTERFEREMMAWHERKAAHARAQAEREAAERAQQEQWQGVLRAYDEKRKALKVRDFEDAEAVILETMSVEQQGLILAYSDAPELVIYALGKNPKRAAELGAITDPLKFGREIWKVESQVKVQTRKPTTQPERVVRGSAPLGSSDANLERLRSEAERTGDYSKVFAYRKAQKQKRA